MSQKVLLGLLLILINIGSLCAQSTGDVCPVQDFNISKLHPLNVDLSVYASGGVHNCGVLWKDTYHYLSMRGNPGRMYGTSASLGLMADFSISNYWSLKSSVGYKQERYAYDWGLFNSTGVRSHWLACDFAVDLINYICLGVRSDIYLGSRINDDGQFSYVGFASDCFRPASIGVYAGIDYAFLDFAISLRYGYEISHQLNADKLAYYNMERTNLKRDFMEVKLSYRLFTTKSKYNHISGY